MYKNTIKTPVADVEMLNPMNAPHNPTEVLHSYSHSHSHASAHSSIFSNCHSLNIHAAPTPMAISIEVNIHMTNSMSILIQENRKFVLI
jgi:hypothetical protein